MQVHRFGVDLGQHQGGTDPARGADRAEQIGPLVALIARRPRAAALLSPDVGQAALLTDPRFVLPPQFDRLAAGMLRNDSGDQFGEVFLCASCAAASCSGCARTHRDAREVQPRHQLADRAFVQAHAELPGDLVAQIDAAASG